MGDVFVLPPPPDLGHILNGGAVLRPIHIGVANSENQGDEVLDFIVFPNPSNGVYTISLRNEQLLGSILHIIDGSGIVVFSKKLDNVEVNIDITQFANGVYYFYVQSYVNSKTKQVIKK